MTLHESEAALTAWLIAQEQPCSECPESKEPKGATLDLSRIGFYMLIGGAALFVAGKVLRK